MRALALLADDCNDIWGTFESLEATAEANRVVFDFNINGGEHSLLLTKAKISVLDEPSYYGCA